MKIIIAVGIILLSLPVMAQNVAQIYRITYKVRPIEPPKINQDTVNTNKKLDINNVEELVAAGKKQEYLQLLDMELELYCNASESLFMLKEGLEPDISDFKARLGFINATSSLDVTGDSRLYINTLKKSKIEQHTLRGTLYKISRPYQNYNWTINDSNKVILGHRCLKATASWEVYNSRTQKIRRATISVWFTRDIPLPFGPSDLNGLSGLVLEGSLENGRTLYATEIKEHYLDKSKILKEPEEGQVMTEAEYRKMLEQRSNRVRQNNRND
jgi:GLPGLI family protein